MESTSKQKIQRTYSMRPNNLSSLAPGQRRTTTRMPLVGGLTQPAIRGSLFLLLLFIAGCGTTAVTKVEVRERTDSLIVRHDTVRVETRSDSVRVDTVWISLPGEEPKPYFRRVKASLDTTLAGVSMKLKYELPPDVWTVRILQRDTTIRWKVRDSIIERPYKVEVVPFWVYLALAGMLIALIVVVVKK